MTVDNKILANDSKVDITKPTNIIGTLHTTDVATFDTNIIIKGSKITKQVTGQNDKDYTLPDETGTLALVSQVNAAETAAKNYTDAEIRNLDASLGDGTKLISTITETDGKLSAYTGPTILDTVNATDNIPTSNAVKTYADNINTDLQNQIDNLKSVQNVVEVVGTKAALNALPKTDYDAGDKVQVIADESLTDSPTSVYELNAARNAWDYVGAYGGNSYTKTEADARFVNRNVQVNGHALTGNVTVTKADVLLGNVDNKSAATLKSEFTGQIAANNTGFVIGNDVYAHTSNTNNPHAVTKAQVGLGNVANLAPADLPVSTAQQTALDGKVDKVTGYGLSKNDFTDLYKAFLDDTPLSVGYDENNKVLYKTTINPSGKDNIVTAAKLRDDAGFITAFQSTPDDNHFVSEKLVKDSLDEKATLDADNVFTGRNTFNVPDVDSGLGFLITPSNPQSGTSKVSLYVRGPVVIENHSLDEELPTRIFGSTRFEQFGVQDVLHPQTVVFNIPARFDGYTLFKDAANTYVRTTLNVGNETVNCDTSLSTISDFFWNPYKAYAIGDIIFYNRALYICETAVSASTIGNMDPAADTAH